MSLLNVFSMKGNKPWGTESNYIPFIFTSGLNEAPNCWAIIVSDRQARALVAKGSELYLVDQGGQYQKQVFIE